MSKPVKELIMKEYQARFGDLDSAVVIDIRGIPAIETNEFRIDLQKQDIRVSVVKNSLAKKSFADSPLSPLEPCFTGPAALAYGADSVIEVARSIVDWAKKIKEIDLKGAVFEGEFYEGAKGVKKLSEFPTKDEALGKVVQLVLSPAGNLVKAATSPGSNILGIVKEIQEKLEKGETIAKVG